MGQLRKHQNTSTKIILSQSNRVTMQDFLFFLCKYFDVCSVALLKCMAFSQHKLIVGTTSVVLDAPSLLTGVIFKKLKKLTKLLDISRGLNRYQIEEKLNFPFNPAFLFFYLFISFAPNHNR